MDIASSLKRNSVETQPEVLGKAIKGVLTGQEKQSTEKAAKKP